MRFLGRTFPLATLVLSAAALVSACGAPQATTPSNSDTTQATQAPAVAQATQAPAEQPTAAPAAEAPTAAPATSGEAVTLTMGDWWDSQTPAIARAIKEFEQANPNIKINRTMQNNFEEVLPAAIQSGSAPDIIMVTFKPSLKEQVDAGWYLPWNNFPDFDAFKKSFPNADSAFVEGVNVYDGKTYTAPIDKPLPSLQLWVNTKLFRDADLVNADGSVKLPETFDDLYASAKTIKEKTGKYGFGLGNADNWRPIQFLLRMCVHDGPVETPAGFFFDLKTGKYVAGGDACMAKLTNTLLKFKNEQLINPDFQSLTDENIKAKFAEGDVAMIVGGTWLVNGWKTTHPDFKDYTATHMPLLQAGQEPYYWYSGVGGQFLAINAKTQHPNEAWAFIKHMYSPAFGLAWAETGNGVNIFTPGDPTKYAENDAMKYVLNAGNEFRVGPQPVVRNPNVGQVKTESTEPSLPEVLTGILTGQIADPKAALSDYDKRNQQALEQGIKDAQDNGLKVSLDDYIFKDWDPTKSYVTTPAK